MPVTSDPCTLLGSDAPELLRDLRLLRSAPRRALRSYAAQALTAWARQIWQQPPEPGELAPGLNALHSGLDQHVDVPTRFTVSLPTPDGRVTVIFFTDGSLLLARLDTSHTSAPRQRFLPWVFGLCAGKSAPVQVNCTNPERHDRQAHLVLRLADRDPVAYPTEAALSLIPDGQSPERLAVSEAFLKPLLHDIRNIAPLFDTACPVTPPAGDSIAFGCLPWRIPDAIYPGAWPWFLPHYSVEPETVACLKEWVRDAATWVLSESEALSTVDLRLHACLPDEEKISASMSLGSQDGLHPVQVGLTLPPVDEDRPSGLRRNGGNGSAGLDRPEIAGISLHRMNADLSSHNRLRLRMRFGEMPDNITSALQQGAPLP